MTITSVQPEERAETTINVRVPVEMLDAAKRRALDEDRTLSQVVRRALRLYIEGALA